MEYIKEKVAKGTMKSSFLKVTINQNSSWDEILEFVEETKESFINHTAISLTKGWEDSKRRNDLKKDRYDRFVRRAILSRISDKFNLQWIRHTFNIEEDYLKEVDKRVENLECTSKSI